MDAWNMMEGIDWQAIPIVTELFGIKDVESFITQLLTIRKYQNDRRD